MIATILLDMAVSMRGRRNYNIAFIENPGISTVGGNIPRGFNQGAVASDP